MSTTFYFKVKADVSIDISIEGIIKDSLMAELKKCIEENTEILIGMRSCGWVPLFYETKYYSSVDEIKKFFSKNKNHWLIVDEYGREHTFKGLEEELFNWNKDNPKAKKHLEISPIDRSYLNFYSDEKGYEFSRLYSNT